MVKHKSGLLSDQWQEVVEALTTIQLTNDVSIAVIIDGLFKAESHGVLPKDIVSTVMTTLERSEQPWVYYGITEGLFRLDSSLEIAESIALIAYVLPHLKPAFLVHDFPLQLKDGLLNSAELKQLEMKISDFKKESEEAAQKQLFMDMMAHIGDVA